MLKTYKVVNDIASLIKEAEEKGKLNRLDIEIIDSVSFPEELI